MLCKSLTGMQLSLPASQAVLNSLGVSGNSWSRNLQISRDSFILLSPQSKVGTCVYCKRISTTCCENCQAPNEPVSNLNISTCRCTRLEQLLLGEPPRLIFVWQAFVCQSKTNAPDERAETPVSIVTSKFPKLQLFGCHDAVRWWILLLHDRLVLKLVMGD